MHREGSILVPGGRTVEQYPQRRSCWMHCAPVAFRNTWGSASIAAYLEEGTMCQLCSGRVPDLANHSSMYHCIDNALETNRNMLYLCFPKDPVVKFWFLQNSNAVLSATQRGLMHLESKVVIPTKQRHQKDQVKLHFGCNKELLYSKDYGQNSQSY